MEVVEVSTGPPIITSFYAGDMATVEIVAQRPVLEVSTADSAVIDVLTPPVQLVQVITPGPSGPQGSTGATGEQGDTGPSPTYEQHFADAVETWVIIHPLNAWPTVTTVDLNGDEIIGDVSIPDKSTVIVSFAMPFAGTARLKA